jgi:hypothetical protein
MIAVCARTITVSVVLIFAGSLAAEDSPYFEIQVIDKATKRGVPLVELVTVNDVRHITDNAGRIAYREPGHAGETIFFAIHAPGYKVPKDGFGLTGARWKIEPGKQVPLELERTNLAERLYRATGQGLYRDSVLLGHKTPLKEPLGTGLVAGQDSIQAAVYRGKLYWFWGDTNRLAYPLGLFRTAGATSALPKDGGLDPSIGIDYEYFTNKEGFARAMAEVKDPKGVVWMDGVCTVKDDEGKTRLVGHYSRRAGLAKAFEQGLMLYNDDREIFEVKTQIPIEEDWRFLQNHPILVQGGETEFLMSGVPFPVTRVPAKFSAVLDPKQYESWSCMEPDADPETARPSRDASGNLDWRWQFGPPVTPKIEARWLKLGHIKPEEARYSPMDADDEKHRVQIHTGSVNYNAYRKKYVMIASEISLSKDSPSMLGEVWYSEADTPQGPFKKAVRILTHDKQSFYNACHHPFFDEDGGRIIYFEGTYTNSFTNASPTPYYNYNQMMYRLDLGSEKIQAAFGAGM